MVLHPEEEEEEEEEASCCSPLPDERWSYVLWCMVEKDPTWKGAVHGHLCEYLVSFGMRGHEGEIHALHHPQESGPCVYNVVYSPMFTCA